MALTKQQIGVVRRCDRVVVQSDSDRVCQRLGDPGRRLPRPASRAHVIRYNDSVMRTVFSTVCCAVLLAVPAVGADDGWVELWDGSTFSGWKLSTDNPSTFKIVDGAIVAQGPRAHLFYAGEVNGGVFRDFELKVDVLAKNNSNGGIYFHTDFQETGWPRKGFEVQVNNTFQRDPRKSGGLYGVSDNLIAPVGDDEWFEEHIVVRGNTVKIYVNGHLITNWVQPEDWDGLRPLPNGRGQSFPERKLSSGTIALQGHDPNSVVMYKNIRIKVLD